MLVIRLFRVGKKKQASFKIVVTDKRRPAKAGRFVEQVGFLNPLTKEKNLKAERIKHWLSIGAKPSPTVYNILVSAKIVEGKKLAKHSKSKKKEEAKKEEIKKEEKPAGEEKKEKEIRQPAEEEKPAEAEKKPEETKPAEPTAKKE